MYQIWRYQVGIVKPCPYGYPFPSLRIYPSVNRCTNSANCRVGPPDSYRDYRDLITPFYILRSSR